MACPDDVSAEAEKEPELVMGDPGPVAGAGGTVRSVGSAWRQLEFVKYAKQTVEKPANYVWVSLPDTINLLSRLLHHKYSLSATRWGPGRPGRDERMLKV